MKRFFAFLLACFGIFLVNSNETSGQGHLHIVQIDSFPQSPADTATAGVTYHNIRVRVTNTASTNFFGDIDVYLQSQSVGFTDTLVGGPLPPVLLMPGDTVSLPANPNYRFRSTVYGAGDNIIVVWPYSVNTPFDIFQSQVYYRLLVGINELTTTAISAFPNPVSGILNLSYDDENNVEQVRICDLSGRELLRLPGAPSQINLSGFEAGVYLLEQKQKNHATLVKKILLNEN